MCAGDRRHLPGDLQAPFARPVGATQVVLVRHGSAADEDDFPPAGRATLDGQSDPSLSSAGVVQAQGVAERLCRIGVDRLFVTPLRRTRETAAPLAVAIGMDPEVVPALREIALGDLEGAEFERRRRAGDPLLMQVFAAQSWDVIPGAEPMELFAQRVRRGLEGVADATGPDATAVAVVHGGVIAELCHQVTSSDRFAFVHVENASCTTVLRMRDGSWRLRSFNDTAHLAGVSRRER